ncbi:krab-a domain-containing protein, partial [Vespula maculifrons]
EVEDWCSTCTVCIIRKDPAGQGKIFTGNRFLSIVVVCFSKWVEVFSQNFRAKMITDTFFEQVVSRHGVSMELRTDQGSNFKSRLFKKIEGTWKTRTRVCIGS